MWNVVNTRSICFVLRFDSLKPAETPRLKIVAFVSALHERPRPEESSQSYTLHVWASSAMGLAGGCPCPLRIRDEAERRIKD